MTILLDVLCVINRLGVAGHTDPQPFEGTWWSAFRNMMFLYPMYQRINCLVIRELLTALLLNPES